MKKRAKARKSFGSRWYWLEILALCALLVMAVSVWHKSPVQQPQRSAQATAKKTEPRKPAARQESRLAAVPQQSAKQDQTAAARRKETHEKKPAPTPATASIPVSSEEYTVFRVADGDTLELRDSRGGTTRVRLYGIDAPEGKQPFGNESRSNMQRMAKGKKVRIKRLYTDNYQRSVAIVFLCENGKTDALSLNERQIQDGMAWVYDFFCTSQECNTWKFEEAMAKTRKIGLWKNPSPTPPWQWRALQEN